ncbi:PREDICTED: protein DOWNY MILDEW RESISTANCE 6-like [Nicotiana attenuata]|uniref:Protein downy mildew resistance 6 n=1 Tax=Nicotiana attenuata TaxID=49451 RepID=A0A314LBU2_NICAT|nr:PREDICTED: protein DOWNY MILDEW RESISTANCE 6-like [Nicotiana attenuata]OIT38973.1 protein downy mildew resistance 6 [Nicotiana attenuata]
MALTAISPSPPSTSNNGNSPSITTDVDYRKGVKYLIDNSKDDMKILPPEFVLPLPEAERPSLAICGSIPVIDLSGLNGTVEQRLATIHAISSACAEWGFFRVTNHGIKISVMDEMLKAVEDFFNLPLEEKMRYASEDVMDPVRYGTSLNTSRKHALHWRDFLRHYGGPIPHSHHLWPDNPPCYRRIAKEYLEEVWKLAIKIFGAISEGLGLDTKYIERSLGEGTQIIAANFYPPCPEPNKTLGLAAHSDHGGLTILMDNGIHGLQIKHNHTWFSVPHVPATLVVNLGDYLEILSNGRYKSVEHRAVVNTEKTRISVAVGHGPEMAAIVQPAGQLLKENSESKYRPIVYKEYIRGQQSTTKRGKSALDEIMTSLNSK